MKNTVTLLFVLQLLFLVPISANERRQSINSSVERMGEHQKYNESKEPPLSVSNNDQVCAETNVWFVWDEQTQSCRCGSDLHGVVLCDTDTNLLLVFGTSCLTLEHTSQGEVLPVVGSCIFKVGNSTPSTTFDKRYHHAPTPCTSLKRQGTLCGQCQDGYTVSAYSYDLKCIRCDSQLENWGIYIVFAFLPLTVFIAITLVFRINALSPELNVFVLAAQLLSSPVFVKIILPYFIRGKYPKFVMVLSKILLILYGIWNLDFLRYGVLPDVCINAIPLHILMLDYLIAIYPMLLIATAYTLLELHDSGFRPLMYLWKPFHPFFAQFRRHWGIQTTLMDAFVTFFFLSTTKLLSVSFSLLESTVLYSSDGKPHSLRLFYDPSVKYFGKEHMPYALLAIGILVVFIAFPTSLLLCYQCKAYKKCLTKCRIRRPIMDKFVSTFHKYYKDGSNGTRDCRWFAGLFILLKISAYLIYTVAQSLNSLYFYLLLVTIIGAVVVVIMEPYKEEYSVFNVMCANLFLWYTLFSTLFAKRLYNFLESELSDHSVCVFILAVAPLVYITGMAVYWKLKGKRGRKDSITSSLPDRLVHSDLYRDSTGFIAELKN